MNDEAAHAFVCVCAAVFILMKCALMMENDLVTMCD